MATERISHLKFMLILTSSVQKLLFAKNLVLLNMSGEIQLLGFCVTNFFLIADIILKYGLFENFAFHKFEKCF